MQPNILRRHASLINAFVRIVDVLITVFSGLLAYYWKFGHISFMPENYIVSLLLGALLTGVGFSFTGIYVSYRQKPPFALLGRVLLTWILLASTLAILVFLTKTGAMYSREWFLKWMIIGFCISLLSRFVLYMTLRHFRKRGYNTRSVVIIGSGEFAQKVHDKLSFRSATGYKLKAFLDQPQKVKSSKIKGIPVCEIPKDLDQYITKNKIDEVWVAVSLNSVKAMRTLLFRLRHTTATIKIMPDIFEMDLVNHSVYEVNGMPVISVRSSPMEGVNAFVKWCEDKILASLILLLISPILLVCAIMVKLSSPGPVFYRQERLSFNGEPFHILKFRSMPTNAESQTGAKWAESGENRATKFGAFLRKTSLDELPQFINVLKGDMSIVGPRPERPVFVDKFKHEIPGYMQKHMVKAGITGWAQINGWRGSTDLKSRIDCDLYYIEHWSLWFDLKIIFLTVFKGFVHKNAY